MTYHVQDLDPAHVQFQEQDRGQQRVPTHLRVELFPEEKSMH